MGHAISGGGGRPETPTYKVGEEKLTRALVIEEVKIIEVPKVYEIPVLKNVETPQTKYITKEELQIKYKIIEKETVSYVPREVDTVKFNVREEETIKYIPKEIQVERPVPVPVEYEIPIVREKIIEVVRHSDVAAMLELRDAVVVVAHALRELKKELDGMKNYKLVEKVIEVPKLQYVNVPVERIIWKDVERERPDANKG